MSPTLHPPRWWAALPIPRGATLLQVVAYLLLAGQGMSNHLSPGVDTQGFHEVVRSVFSFTLVVAGLGGAVSAFKGWWVVERPLISMIMVVYLMHLYWTLADLDKDGVIPVQTAFRMLIIFTLMGNRFFKIRHYMLDPTR